MSSEYQTLLERIEKLEECSEDLEDFHIDRDRVLWNLLNATLDGSINKRQAFRLRNKIIPLMKKVVWYV